MRLTRIEIENFKGIGSRQRIDLRPITLLFGPNSAGKSTILQALHYLREILERGNVDPDRTVAGGLIDLGGFATLVHNHELDRTVILKVVLDLSDEQGSEGLPLNAGLSIGEPEFAELPVRYLVGESEEYRDYAIVQDVGLEVDIHWSALEQAPYVSRLAIELDGEPLAAIVSPPAEGRAQLTDFNFGHPHLRRAVLPDDMPEDGDDDFAAGSPLEDEIWSLAREAAADRSTPDTPDDQLRIAVGTELGALPRLDRDLILDIRDPDVKKAELEERTPRVNGLRALLSEMILGPARLVRDHLMQMTYIGPLLHVHPAIQVGIGDLFIKAATGDQEKLTSGKTLLIETHSEHIMLRLLRRVREQTEGEVPPGVLGLLSASVTTVAPSYSDGESSIYVPSRECHWHRSVQPQPRKKKAVSCGCKLFTKSTQS
jgi:hypothetical protein